MTVQQVITAPNGSENFLASAARTADVTQEFRMKEQVGVLIVVDVTAFTAGTLTPRLQVQAGSDGWVTTWTAAAAIAATGTFTYLHYPGALTGGYTEVLGRPLPQKNRLFMDASTADSITYSVRMYAIP